MGVHVSKRARCGAGTGLSLKAAIAAALQVDGAKAEQLKVLVNGKVPAGEDRLPDLTGAKLVCIVAAELLGTAQLEAPPSAGEPAGDAPSARRRTRRQQRLAATDGANSGCGICQDTILTENRATIDGCDHVFCYECIHKW